MGGGSVFILTPVPSWSIEEARDSAYFFWQESSALNSPIFRFSAETTNFSPSISLCNFSRVAVITWVFDVFLEKRDIDRDFDFSGITFALVLLALRELGFGGDDENMISPSLFIQYILLFRYSYPIVMIVVNSRQQYEPVSDFSTKRTISFQWDICGLKEKLTPLERWRKECNDVLFFNSLGSRGPGSGF